MKKYYRIDEVAKEFEVSRRTIERAIERGEIHTFRVGQTRRVDAEELERMKKERDFFSRPQRPRITYGEDIAGTCGDLCDAMGQAVRSFDFQEIEKLRGPIVYAWVRSGKVLYIGQSACGISRPFGLGHHRINPQSGDTILIWSAYDKSAAIRIERDLIRRLKPAFNLKTNA